MRTISTPTSADQASLEAFAREQGQRLLRCAFLLTGGNGAAAEDLVQTVLMRLSARGIDDLDDPFSYARRAMLNEQISGARRASTLRRGLTRIGPPHDEVSGPSDDRLSILGALETLSARERAVIVLRYYEDLPDPEIAAVLGCSRVTVRSLAHRANRKLRNELASTYERLTGQTEAEGDHDD